MQTNPVSSVCCSNNTIGASADVLGLPGHTDRLSERERERETKPDRERQRLKGKEKHSKMANKIVMREDEDTGRES